MEYSKGPWHWEDDRLADKNGNAVIDIFEHPNNLWLRVNPDGNQTLIQSAPDMYEALKAINEFIAKGGLLGIKDKPYEMLIDALAKAEDI